MPSPHQSKATQTAMELAIQRRDLARQSLESAEKEIFDIMVKTAKAMRAAGCTWMYSETDPMRNLAWQVASEDTQEST